jgi:hypothetical protein
MFRTVIFICCVLAALPEAKAGGETERRRSVLIPSIQAISDCMAQEAIKLPGLAFAIKNNDWRDLSKELATHCAERVNAMIQIHDRLYGAGTGLSFFQRGYMKDLPRAVRSRIQPQIVDKLMKSNKDEKVQPRDLPIKEPQRKASPPGGDTTAVLPKDAAKDKEIGKEKGIGKDKDTAKNEGIGKDRDTAKNEDIGKDKDVGKDPGTPQLEPAIKEAEHGAVEPIEDAKAVALRAARTKMHTSREKLYECTDSTLAELARSSSNGEALAAAVMAKCNSDFEAALQSVVEIFRIDAGIDEVTNLQRSLLRDEIVKIVKEHIVAGAGESSGSQGTH